MATAYPPFKRYCKALTLKDDPALMAEYKKIHRPEVAWPEVTQGMKEVGILDMEIYRYGNTLFMIMDTVADFEHERAMSQLAAKPRQAEWEAYVAKFQETDANASAKDKWQLLERVYELDQQAEQMPEEGQVKA